MIALYNGLLSTGLASGVAWRAAFVIIPVPFLILVAVSVMVFGTDHPAGKWSDRHQAITPRLGRDSRKLDDVSEDEKALDRPDESKDDPEKKDGLENVQVTVVEIDSSSSSFRSRQAIYRADICLVDMVSELDHAVNEPLTLKLALKVVSMPLTWLPALAYFTTFGYELAIDANLANVLLSLYKSNTFGQTKAGYVSNTSQSSSRL